VPSLYHACPLYRLILGTSVDFASPGTPVANGLEALAGESYDMVSILTRESVKIIDGVILAFHLQSP
jgi:hypothetical protein